MIAISCFATEVTLYHGEAYIQENRTVEKIADQSAIVGLPKGIDPATIRFDQNVSWWRYEEGKLTPQKVLKPYLGKRITFLYEKKAHRGRLLSIDPIMILSDRLYSDIPFKDILLKPKVIAYLPTLYLDQCPQKRLDLQYLCQGLDYRVQYIAKIGKKLHLSSNLHITNRTGYTFHNAKIKIIASREQRYIPTRAMAVSGKPQKIAGVYRYELPNRWEIEDHKTIPFILVNSDYSIAYRATFFDANRAFGKEERYFDQMIRFKTSIPLPGGHIIFVRDNEVVGQTWVNPKSSNQEVEMAIGKDFDKKIVRLQRFFTKKKRHFQTTIEYRFVNPDGKPVTMEVIEHLQTTNLSVTGSCHYKILDATRLQILHQAKSTESTCELSFQL